MNPLGLHLGSEELQKKKEFGPMPKLPGPPPTHLEWQRRASSSELRLFHFSLCPTGGPLHIASAPWRLRLKTNLTDLQTLLPEAHLQQPIRFVKDDNLQQLHVDLLWHFKLFQVFVRLARIAYSSSDPRADQAWPPPSLADVSMRQPDHVPRSHQRPADK